METIITETYTVFQANQTTTSTKFAALFDPSPQATSQTILDYRHRMRQGTPRVHQASTPQISSPKCLGLEKVLEKYGTV
jgi:hypothetical protein